MIDCFVMLLLYRCLTFSCVYFFFFKQKTAYEMRISDWSSDVCSSDLAVAVPVRLAGGRRRQPVYPRRQGAAGRARQTDAGADPRRRLRRPDAPAPDRT